MQCKSCTPATSMVRAMGAVAEAKSEQGFDLLKAIGDNWEWAKKNILVWTCGEGKTDKQYMECVAGILGIAVEQVQKIATKFDGKMSNDERAAMMARFRERANLSMAAIRQNAIFKRVMPDGSVVFTQRSPVTGEQQVVLPSAEQQALAVEESSARAYGIGAALVVGGLAFAVIKAVEYFEEKSLQRR